MYPLPPKYYRRFRGGMYFPHDVAVGLAIESITYPKGNKNYFCGWLP
jgi:hypothetical protein